MTYSFKATHVFSEDTDGVKIVGFADDNAAPTQYLILQQPQQYDEQDVKLGMDKVHVEVGHQSRSTYGGIKVVTSDKGRLSFELESSASEALQTDGNIVIDLLSPEPEIKKVLAALKAVARKEGFSFDEIS